MPDEQAVIVHLKLRSTWGDVDERGPIFALEDVLGEAIEQSGSGEYDGDEWGQGECVLFMYGPNAERLFETISMELLKFKANPGSWCVLRYGPPGAEVKKVGL